MHALILEWNLTHVTSACGRLRRDDGEFEVSLGYRLQSETDSKEKGSENYGSGLSRVFLDSTAVFLHGYFNG